jgi:hypothetical protein
MALSAGTGVSKQPTGAEVTIALTDLQVALTSLVALATAANTTANQALTRVATVEPIVNGLNSQQQQNVAAIAAAQAGVTQAQQSINANTAADAQKATQIAGLQTGLSVAQGDINILKQAGGAVESPNGTPITPGAGTAYDAAVAAWTIAGSLPAGGHPQKAGVDYGSVTTAVFGKYYKPTSAAGVMYFKDFAGAWWKDNGTTLVANTAGDPDAPITIAESTNGAAITPSSGTDYDSALAPWTIAGSLPAGGQVKKSGANYGSVTTAVYGKYYKPTSAAGVMYFKDAANNWWRDNGTTLVANTAGDPDNPTVISESTDNTSITLNNGFLYDANLYRWAVVLNFPGTATGSTSLVTRAPPYTGPDIWPNSTIVPPTDQGNHDVQSAFYNGHAVYQVNTIGAIYKVVLTPPSTFVGSGPITPDPRGTSSLPTIAAAAKPGGVIQFGGIASNELTNFNQYCGWWRLTADATADSAPLWNGTTFTNTMAQLMGTGKIVFIITYFAYGSDVTNYNDPTTVNTTKLNSYINTYIPAMVAGVRSRYPNSQNQIVWQVYNEPHMRQDLLRGTWLPAIITAIRNAEIAQGEPPHYIAVMASDAPTAGGHQDWDIGLINMAPFSDTRIIYGFHWYTPGNYTGQGTAGWPAAGTVSYPQSGDQTTLTNRFNAVNNYKNTNSVPILLDEYNCAGFDPGSSGPGFRPMPLMRSRFMKDITDAAKSRGFIVGPFGIQDYNSWDPLVDNARPNRVIAAQLITRDFGDGLGPVPIVWG